MTISGLNSGDAIAFLSDMGSTLIWAGGSAENAQVVLQSGDVANLATWVAAAQNQVTQAHSIAWFNFDGATYILESAVGAGISHASDTLVRLTGSATLSDSGVELSQGILQFVG